MLGMSCEDTSPPYGPAAARGPTLITCAFSGHSTLWRVNTREVERLHELPARRLKGLLRARGIPIEGLREKEEFVRLIARANALPVASSADTASALLMHGSFWHYSRVLR
jgi:hypothetical protein